MIDAQTLLAKIGQKVKQLEAATERYKQALAESQAKGIEWAGAEALYKKVRYTAELEHDGPAHERRAAGEVASVKDREAWRRAEVADSAAKE